MSESSLVTEELYLGSPKPLPTAKAALVAFIEKKKKKKTIIYNMYYYYFNKKQFNISFTIQYLSNPLAFLIFCVIVPTEIDVL